MRNPPFNAIQGLTGEAELSDERIQRRLKLYRQFLDVPEEALARLQFLQVQVGCANRCAFCSQSAGSDIWRLTSDGLADMVAALGAASRQRGVELGSGRKTHRQNVLFPYLDDDVFSYPYLDKLFFYAHHELRVRLRLSTVGYATANKALHDMHKRIVRDHIADLAGIRFSFTPYTLGYQKNRDQYIRDLAICIKTYRPASEALGWGPESAAVELRFPPLVYADDGPLFDDFVLGLHVFAKGPHILISISPSYSRPNVGQIRDVQGKRASILIKPTKYMMLTSNDFMSDPDIHQIIKNYSRGAYENSWTAKEVEVHTWSNSEGKYYAVDAIPHPDGCFTAMQFYPKTETRKRSGYIDSTRYFLNALLAVKNEFSLRGNSSQNLISWDHVQECLQLIAKNAKSIAAFDHLAASHIEQHVLPLVTAYVQMLRLADFPPHSFFDKQWTIDTGQIVNQGRALGMFRGLTKSLDEPLSPHEDRAYGAVSLSSSRGSVWRLAPSPSQPSGYPVRNIAAGRKSYPRPEGSLILEELDPRHLLPVDRETGRPLRQYVLGEVDIEHVPANQHQILLNFPGSRN